MFSAVFEAYRTLKIPLPLIDAAWGAVGNWEYRAPRSVAGQRMSSWLPCGTTLLTALVAGATSLDGAYREHMPCLSTGRFEARVQALVEGWLAAHP